MPFLADDIVLDHDQSAAPSATAPTTSAPDDLDNEQFNVALRHLALAGATPQELYSFAQKHGRQLAAGVDENVASAKAGGDVAVVTVGDKPAETTPTAEPVGGRILPEDAQIEPLPAEHNWLDQLGIGGRAVLKGVEDINPFETPRKLTEAITGDPTLNTDNRIDQMGLARPESDNEHLASAAIEGATAGGLTGGAAFIPAALGGAAAGAAGEGARQAGYGPAAQLGVSLLAGGVTGLGAAGAGSAAKRVAASTEPSELLAAFQRQQVTPMAAQVGGLGSKMMTSGAKATLGGLPLASAAEKSIATAKAARDRIAAGMGAIADDTGAGQAAQRGVRSFIASTEARAGKLYDAIPIASNKPAVLSNTKAALNDLNAGLESNPELSAMLADGRLKGYEAALAGKAEQIPTGLLDAAGKPIMRTVTKGGALSWADLKAFRSYIGELAGRPAMQESTSKEALQRLYAGLSEDMKATAASEGPAASKAFSRANSYYRGRQSRIENTLKLILGNDYQKSPESAFAQIDRWAREGGDAARLARTIRSMPADEAATIRATLFSRLGRAAPGQQNAAVDSFSPASFVTQWAKLDHRAKSVLFPTAEYRQSLDDIAKIAESMKSSEKFANTSGTALAERIGGNLLGAAVLGYIMHPTTAIAGEGIGWSAGMLLGSPRFAKWLASAPKKPVGSATLAHINRLSVIAASEPQIANQVLALQERLASAFVPTRAAADDNQGKPKAATSRQPGPRGQ